jgi:hypothetical protein
MEESMKRRRLNGEELKVLTVRMPVGKASKTALIQTVANDNGTAGKNGHKRGADDNDSSEDQPRLKKPRTSSESSKSNKECVLVPPVKAPSRPVSAKKSRQLRQKRKSLIETGRIIGFEQLVVALQRKDNN